MVDEIKIQSTQSIQNAKPASSSQGSRIQNTGDTSFAETLAQTQNLTFSNHAQKRL